LEAHPDDHTAPAPHSMSEVEQVETDDGPKTLTRCIHCHKTVRQLAKG
jgi:hypothetical protein